MYSLHFSEMATAFVKNLEPKRARQVYEKTINLQFDPRPQASTPLIAHKGYTRLRVGDFRVVYRVTGQVIYIDLIDNRGDDEVYKKLERLVS